MERQQEQLRKLNSDMEDWKKELTLFRKEVTLVFLKNARGTCILFFSKANGLEATSVLNFMSLQMATEITWL